MQAGGEGLDVTLPEGGEDLGRGRGLREFAFPPETVDLARTRRFEARLPDGRWMFVASEAVGATGLSAIAVSPLADIKAAAHRDLALAVGLPLAFLMIAVAVAWYGIKRIGSVL